MQTKLSPARTRILQSGLDLLSETGLSGVTLGVLAEQVGMSKSGLFAHFKSKEEVQISLLRHTAEAAHAHIVLPAMQEPAGLPRLCALVRLWLGWATRAGLRGGCPVAAAAFETDDQEGPVRDQVLAMEAQWRELLVQLVQEAVALGHLRPDLDAEQFVWELSGLYLSHHASLRFLRDPKADARAETALQALLDRARSSVRERGMC